MDRIEADGRSLTSSTLLYLDGKARDFLDAGCSGTQSSRRMDGQTVEILSWCANGDTIRFVRRLSVQPNELILDITEHRAGGRTLERHMVLKKQSVTEGQ